MALTLVATADLRVGTDLVVDAESPDGRHAVVFEDDGDSGYFYAVDTHVEDGNPVQDALEIYQVADVLDADVASRLEIGWSDDGLKALLLINDAPHAVFDFALKQGWCKLALPVPSADAEWSARGHAWDDAVEAYFD